MVLEFTAERRSVLTGSAFSGQLRQSAKIVTEKDRLAQIVHPVAVAPYGPHVLQTEVPTIPGRVHHFDDPLKIDRVVLKGCLE